MAMDLLEPNRSVANHTTVFSPKVGQPFYAFVFVLVLFLSQTFDLFAQNAEVDGQIAFETGMSYVVQRNYPEGFASFQKAASQSGNYADAARIEMIRLLPFVRKTGESEILGEMLSIRSSVQDEKQKAVAHFASVLSLHNSNFRKSAFEQGLDYSIRFADDDFADDALYIAAMSLKESEEYEASLALLYRLLTLYATSDSVDDAHYLLAQLDLRMGNIPSAKNHLDFFTRDEKIYAESIYRDMALKQLESLRQESIPIAD